MKNYIIERPIIYSRLMILARAAKLKTQVRCTQGLKKVNQAPNEWRLVEQLSSSTEALLEAVFERGLGGEQITVNCPFGKPGHHLWIKEAWRIGAWNVDEGEIAVDYMADQFYSHLWLQVPEPEIFENYWLQCCHDCDKARFYPNEEGMYHWAPGQSPCRLRPPVSMPRFASRGFDKIVSIRLERLQDISDGDVAAEGCGWNEPLRVSPPDPRDGSSPAQRSYSRLWNTVHSKEPWSKNPWVWVVEFKIIS